MNKDAKKAEYRQRDHDMVLWCRTQALKLGDVNRIIVPPKHFKIHHEEMLTDTLREIGRYIDHCFDLYDSPLTHLRKEFPAFDWEYTDPTNRTHAARIVKNNDYSWLAYPDFDWSMGMISTKLRVRSEPKRFAYQEHQEDADDFNWPREELRSEFCWIFCGGQFI